MKKSNAKSADAQVKKGLAILKRKGLYKPVDKKAKPTRYALDKLKQYRDVVSGKATVLKAPSKASLRKARETYRVTRDRIVVGERKGAKVTLNKRGDVITKRGWGAVTTVSRPARIINGRPEQLKDGQYYTLPIRHGRNIAFRNVDSLDELMLIVGEYNDGKRPFDALKYVEITTFSSGDKFRINYIDPLNGKRRQRTVNARDEMSAIGAFREQYPEHATALVISAKKL